MAKLYDWGDGKGRVHTIPLNQHTDNVNAARVAALTPPPSLYDPSLDAQLNASGRGLSDLIENIGADTGTQRVRSADDYAIAQAQLAQQRARDTQDYGSAVGSTNTSYGRSLADLLTTRSRGAENYQTSLANLSRQYQQLGDVQQQSAAKAGALEGSGAYAQAARKRAANQAIEQAPIETAYQRFTGDSALSEQRLGQDQSTALSNLLTQYTRGGENLDVQSGQLGQTYARQGQDYDTQLERAAREAGAFALDTANAKAAQASQLGWAPTLPKAGATMTPAQGFAASQAAARRQQTAALRRAKKRVV